MVRFLSIALLGLLGFPNGAISGDCQTGKTSIPKASKALSTDLEKILDQIDSKEALEVGPVDVGQTEIDQDFLILPGKKVGSYVLGSTEDTIETQSKLQRGQERVRKDYPFLLLLGYVAKRWMRKDLGSELEFAFDPKKKVLREVFVRSEDYQTPEGWHVGQRVGEITWPKDVDRKKGASGTEYFRLKGITLLVRSGKIEEIVVTTPL